MAAMSRSWLYVAFGISAALLIVGAFAIIIAQAELASGKRTITMIGEVVCLPHKKPWFGLFGGRAETQECRFGFLGKDGRHYGIDYNSGNESFWAFAEDIGQPLLISGEITIPAEAFPSSEGLGLDRYDIVGVIVVGSATSIEE